MGWVNMSNTIRQYGHAWVDLTPVITEEEHQDGFRHLGVGRWPDKVIRGHPSQPPTWKSYAGWVLKRLQAVWTLQAVQSPPCGLFQKVNDYMPSI